MDIALGFMFYWDMTDILIDIRMYAKTRLKFGYMRFYLYLSALKQHFNNIFNVSSTKIINI